MPDSPAYEPPVIRDEDPLASEPSPTIQQEPCRILPPIPPLRSWISRFETLKSPYLWTSQLSRILSRSGDFQKYEAQLLGKSEREGKEQIASPLHQNAILARAQKLDGTIRSRAISHAMENAVKNPLAMLALMRLYGANTQAKSREDILIETATFVRICYEISSKTRTRASPSVVWSKDQSKLQWLHVTTGWTGNSSGNNRPTSRDCCLYDMGPKHDARHLPTYVRLLGKFADLTVLEKELDFLSKAHSREWTLPQDQSDIRRMYERRKIQNAIVDAYLEVGHPDKAWQEAYKLEDVDKFLNHRVLYSLMEYPEFVKTWSPRIERVALQVLDEKLEEIERKLGIRWVRGDYGHHRLVNHHPSRREKKRLSRDTRRGRRRLRLKKGFRPSSRPFSSNRSMPCNQEST